MDREENFRRLDEEIEKWSDDERKFVLWQLLKKYRDGLKLSENLNTVGDYSKMFLTTRLNTDCYELIDMLNFELWR